MLGGPAGGAGGRRGEAPPWPTRTEGATQGRNSLLHFRSRYKSGVCVFQKTQKKEKGQARSFPLSHELRGTLGSGEMEPSGALAQAARPEPITKGHSQSGLIRQRTGQAGTFRARTQSGPCGGRGAGARGASDSKTRVCLLTTLQPGRRETERLIWGDKETLPLTVDGLFLEMGRLFSVAAVSVPPALPASVPSNAA